MKYLKVTTPDLKVVRMRKLEFVGSVQFLSLCMMIKVLIVPISKCGLNFYCKPNDKRSSGRDIKFLVNF